MNRPLALALIVALAALPTHRTSQAAWSANGDPVCSAPREQVPFAGVSTTGCLVGPCAAGALFAWVDDRDPNDAAADLYFGAVAASGVLDPPPGGTPLCTECVPLGTPSLAELEPSGGPLPWGGYVVAWADSRGSDVDVYAQHVGPAWATDGVPVCTVAGDVRDVRVVRGGWFGKSIVAWIDERPGAAGVYAQKLDADGGGLWTLDGQQVVATPTFKTLLRAAPDGADGVYLVWSDYGAFGLEVRAIRIDGDGVTVPGWPASGVIVPGAESDVYGVAALPTADGGLIVVFERGTYDAQRTLLAQKLDGSGQRWSGWPSEGVLVSRTGGARFFSDAIPFQGGAVVAWEEWSAFSDVFPPPPYDSDLHLARVTASGTIAPGWPDSGRVVCSGTGERGALHVVESGGALMCAWEDERAGLGQNDIYATRVLADGSVDAAWPANGAPVCSAIGAQSEPRLFASAGGAIAAWTDRRAGDADVYARFVSATGAVGSPASAAPRALRLGAATPNPARGPVRFALELAHAADCVIDIVDPAGRRIARLAAARFESGAHEVRWDGRSEDGRPARPGLYFARVRTGEGAASRAFVRLR